MLRRNDIKAYYRRLWWSRVVSALALRWTPQRKADGQSFR